MAKATKAGIGPEVLQRQLGACDLGLPNVPRLLEAVTGPDGRLMAFFGQGTAPDAFAPDGGEGCAKPLEMREVSGAFMVVAEGPALLALSSGGALELSPVPAEPEFLAGLNCSAGFRLEETAAQVAEGLRHHATAHGLQGALIVNRLPDGGGFAAELGKALAGVSLRIIVLDCPVPLGKPGLGPENHVYLAPDAPGKDRMDMPAPDAWRAPLGEGLVFEALKWRFLAEARAVLMLDVTDILAPAPTPADNAFDLCVKHGSIALMGQRIYPWRVRKGQNAAFGDHICRPFDLGKLTQRWGAAPAKAGLENTWRMTRISYAKPQAGAGFYRAMAIRVPGRSAAELAPKTSLVADDGLLALSEALGHKPVLPPVSKTRQAPAAAIKAGRTAIMTTMKNEGPFIMEWLAYHRAIGVDDFLVYTNDCDDGTDTMLDLLQAKGIVQHRDNPFRASGLKPQHAALQAAESEPVMQDCGWGICMDVDEFICIKIGDGTLEALYKAMGTANMISLTWRLFGNAEVHEFQDRFITEQFTRCAPEVIRKPHQAWGFKTLFRNLDMYKKLGVHRPKGLVPDLWDNVQWLNGSGRPMPRSMFRNGWRSSLETYGYDWVSLNHYAVRSAESFLVKRDRGRVNHVDRDQGLNYWFRMNHNVDEDHAIQRVLPLARAEYARLMADPDIAAAHAKSVACHRAKIAELRATPAPAAFYDELTSARMERLCRLQKHFGSAVFSVGPQVVPDEVLAGDLAEDFFFTIRPTAEQKH